MQKMQITLLFAVFLIIIILTELYDREDSRIIGKLSYDAERVVPGITKRCTILSGESTYTLNKQKIYILLRNPDTSEYYDYNTLLYALLHEIAHVLSPDIGHTKTFLRIFSDLLNKASSLGIYKAGKVDMNYCRKCVV
jgi:WLM domain